MRPRYISLYVILIFSFFIHATKGNNDFDSLLKVLDNTINESNKYMDIKEQRIGVLNDMLNQRSNSSVKKFDILFQIVEEYAPYQTDSAISYTERLLHLAQEESNLYWITKAKIWLAILFTVNGMNTESLNILNSVDKKILTPDLKYQYYNTLGRLYEYLTVQSVGKKYITKYDRFSNAYKDTAFSFLTTESALYDFIYPSRLMANRKYKEAHNYLFDFYKTLDENSHAAAIIAYLIAETNKHLGDKKNMKKYYALSAISDIKSAVKENASLQQLAIILYKEGEIDRAYTYIKFALADATFCNAIHRQVQISQALPIIDRAYTSKAIIQQRRIKISLLIISLLSFIILSVLFIVYNQKIKLTNARKELSKINADLENVNDNLNNSNLKLLDINERLREADHIKEEYIGHFINLCSIYIDKLDDFRKLVFRNLLTHKVEDLLKMAKSKNYIENELEEFYKIFDNTFLHLFPTFVKDFDQLLVAEARFNLKQGEPLNPELRIFALIRLGISDSNKIASFLRYSPQTIYNYRTKVKNKSLVERENFENEVLKIGVVYSY